MTERHRVSHAVPSVISLSLSTIHLRTVSLLPLPHDAYMLTSTYVYVCVFVNIHIFRNMCMGADIYNNCIDTVYYNRSFEVFVFA